MVQEQELFLDWLCSEVIEKENIELFILAGDIFDVPHPPTDAIALFSRFLIKLKENKNLKTLIIPGNHDSSRFFDSIAPLIEDENIIIKTKFDDYKSPLKFNNEVMIHALPYFKWSDLLNIKSELSLDNDDELHIFKQFIKKFSTLKNNTQKNILVAHHVFGDFLPAGSEQGLHLSGINSLPLNLFEDHFDILCLGHIHRHQVLRKENPLSIYSGAPMPFRFSEKGKKTVTIYNLSDEIKYEQKEIPFFRDVCSITCEESNWKKTVESNLEDLNTNHLTAYLEIVLKLEHPNAELVESIKEYLKNKDIELINFKTNLQTLQESAQQQQLDIDDLSTERLFELFYLNKFGEQKEVPEEIKNDFTALLQECRNINNLTNEGDFSQ